MKLKCVDLCSGIGGNALALDAWCETILFCEHNQSCKDVLARHYPAVPIHDDVRTLVTSFDSYNLPPVDIVCAGFPCQDISISGSGKGIANGARSGLFYNIAEFLEKIRPPYVFLENVPAIRGRGLDIVLHKLSGMKYTCRWCVLSAADVGAPHLRERWFLFAVNESYARTNVLLRDVMARTSEERGADFEWSRVMDRRADVAVNEPPIVAASGSIIAHGMLGNAVVPKQAVRAFVYLSSRENDRIMNSISLLQEASGPLPVEGSLEYNAHGRPVVLKYAPMVFTPNFRVHPDLMYATPTQVLRACEGSVRRARALFLAGHLNYEQARVVAGKCPLLSQGAIPALTEDRYRHLHVPEERSKRSCYRERNVRWVEWLMGFPLYWVDV